MAVAQDKDSAYTGRLNASVPRHTLEQGSVTRLLNARFVHGAITNAVGFEDFDPIYINGPTDPIPTSTVTFQDLLQLGDIQLLAPLHNIAGRFLIVVISGRIFQIDADTCIARDITPLDACLPENSAFIQLSYLDNDGGIYGSGGYLVIFNDNNKPIFIDENGARLADSSAPHYEMPPARMGVTAGFRAFVATGRNLMLASDVFGGNQALAPLTFTEILMSGTGFTGEFDEIGSVLNSSKITAMCRLPKFGARSQEFLAQNFLVSTRDQKYIIAGGAPRDTWNTIQFITFAGSGPGVAGPLACTTVGDSLIYIDRTGRIKSIGQDRERAESLSETYFDDPLGQYVCCNDPNFYFRDWYETLDHSRSVIKFDGLRLYATVYPYYAPSINQFGKERNTISHRALAIGSIDSRTLIGERARITWEGFYDWLNPVSITMLDGDLFVISKDCNGRIRFHKRNRVKIDEHDSVIYTRGFLNQVDSSTKSILQGSLYFRTLQKESISVRVDVLINDEWICGQECVVKNKLHRFNVEKGRCKTDSSSIPLRITVKHNGCKFELEQTHVKGELYRDKT